MIPATKHPRMPDALIQYQRTMCPDIPLQPFVNAGYVAVPLSSSFTVSTRCQHPWENISHE